MELVDFSVTPISPMAPPFSKNAFLEVLQETASVREACLSLGIKEATAYSAKRKDAKFAEHWNLAMQVGSIDLLEAEAVRRALAGSDQLMMFLLKAANRGRYDDAIARASVESKDIQIRVSDVLGKIKAGK